MPVIWGGVKFYSENRKLIFSPPPCGEGSGVGVPQREQCLETPTPNPSPQGGGEKLPHRSTENRRCVGPGSEAGTTSAQIIRATNGILRSHTVSSQLEDSVPVNTMAALTPAGHAGS
jgi:hypothetical protein